MENALAVRGSRSDRIGYAPELVFVLGCAVLSNTGPDAVGLIYEGTKRER